MSALPADLVLGLADAVWNIPDDVADVPDGIPNVRHLVQDVGGDELDVRDGVLHVPERVGDIRNAVWNVQNAVPNVRDGVWNIPELVADILNVVWNIRSAVLKVLGDGWNVRKLVAEIRRQGCKTGNSIFSGGNIMAYKRRSSQVIADAQERATNLKTIDPALDLGGGLTVMAFEADIAVTQTALEAYNTLLAKADAAANELNALEKHLGTFSGRMLAGVGAQFGKDSSEYEVAGGVRTSEIKRGGKKEEPENGGA